MKYGRVSAELPPQPFPALREQKTGTNPPLVKSNAFWSLLLGTPLRFSVHKGKDFIKSLLGGE